MRICKAIMMKFNLRMRCINRQPLLASVEILFSLNSISAGISEFFILPHPHQAFGRNFSELFPAILMYYSPRDRMSPRFKLIFCIWCALWIPNEFQNKVLLILFAGVAVHSPLHKRYEHYIIRISRTHSSRESSGVNFHSYCSHSEFLWFPSIFFVFHIYSLKVILQRYHAHILPSIIFTLVLWAFVLNATWWQLP